MKWNKTSLSSTGPEESAQASAPASFPAFAPIISNALDQLKDLPPLQSIPAGHLLIEQGWKGGVVYLLRSGVVKLTHGTPDGRETTLGLRGAGWCAGAAWAMTKTPCMYSVTAVTECSVSCMAAEDFSARLMQNTRLLRHFMNSLCNELMSQAACDVQIRGWSAQDRLQNFMRERAAEHQQLKTVDALPLLKQMELAQLLAVTPEHLCRLMHKTSASLKAWSRRPSSKWCRCAPSARRRSFLTE